METVASFTAKQKQWIWRRDEGQCTFHFPRFGLWIRCKNKDTDLDVHHIEPRGYSRLWKPETFNANGPQNLCLICKEHHRGYNADGDYRFVLHPDVEEARLAYGRGNHNAFKEMGDARRKLNEQGIPYWNQRFDNFFKDWAKKRTLLYLRAYPDDPYPDDGIRGRTGRL